MCYPRTAGIVCIEPGILSVALLPVAVGPFVFGSHYYDGEELVLHSPLKENSSFCKASQNSLYISKESVLLIPVLFLSYHQNNRQE